MGEEIIIKNLAKPDKYFYINVPAFENPVYIGTVAMHLLCQPYHRVSVVFKLTLYQFSYVYILLHYITPKFYKIKNVGYILSVLEVLDYLYNK